MKPVLPALVALCALTVAGLPAVGSAESAPPVGEPRMFATWGLRVGGPEVADTAGDVALHKGSAYLVGTREGTGRGRVVVVKVDDDGTRVWKRTPTTSTDDVAVGAEAGAFGTVVLANAPGGFWVRRYSARGTLRWASPSIAFEGLGAAVATDIEVIRRTVVVVGSADGAGSDGGDARLIARLSLADGTSGGYSVDAAGADSSWTAATVIGTDLVVVGRVGDPAAAESRVLVRRLNPLTWVRRWSRTVNSVGPDAPGGISAYSKSLYVTGSVGGPLAGGPAVSGASDPFVAAFRGNGKPRWSTTVPSPGTDPAALVAATPNGAILAVTRPGSSDDGTSSRIRLHRFARSSPLVETRVLNGPGFDRVDAVAWNFHGLKVAGTTRSRLFGPATGGLDMFLTKYAVVVKGRQPA